MWFIRNLNMKKVEYLIKGEYEICDGVISKCEMVGTKL